MYSMERGIPLDFTKAAELLQQAVDQGHGPAMSYLGFLNFQGYGVPKDPEIAARLCQQAAQLRVFGASYNLALMYERGDGVPIDLQKYCGTV
jgi:TPR repeat protein